MEFALPQVWILKAVDYDDDFELCKGSRILVPRKYYSSILGRIRTSPYLIFNLKCFDNEKEITVSIAAPHNKDENVLIVPTWILEYLDATDNNVCNIIFQSEHTQIQPITQIMCHVEMTKQFQEDLELDIRSAVEHVLEDMEILNANMPFQINLPEIDTYVNCKIMYISSEDGIEFSSGYVKPNSDVSVEFTFIPEEFIPPMRSLPQLNQPPQPPQPPQLPPQLPPQPPQPPQPLQSSLSSEERTRLIRESWLKRLESKQ